MNNDSITLSLYHSVNQLHMKHNTIILILILILILTFSRSGDLGDDTTSVNLTFIFLLVCLFSTLIVSLST